MRVSFPGRSSVVLADDTIRSYLFRDRLVVGRRALDAETGVRVPVPEVWKGGDASVRRGEVGLMPSRG